MTHNSDFEDGASRLGALLTECRQRLSEHEATTVRAADAAIRHLFALGLQLKEIEDRTESPELRAQIASAIDLADATISELRRMVNGIQDRNRDD